MVPGPRSFLHRALSALRVEARDVHIVAQSPHCVFSEDGSELENVIQTSGASVVFLLEINKR